MRYLVISDIHANLEALKAVLADAPSWDEVWSLGDLVGYGPDPNECVESVQGLPAVGLAGNHDWGVLGKLDLSEFNGDARVANLWTAQELAEPARAYLDALPVVLERDGFTLVHASPREPIWEYILDTTTAGANFAHFTTNVCLVGHSHVPLAFEWHGARGRCEFLSELFDRSADDPITLSLGVRRLILNPGSVGQPRDGDPRASYAVLDTDQMTWELRRVAYDIELVQKRMRARRLPRQLVERLAYGR